MLAEDALSSSAENSTSRAVVCITAIVCLSCSAAYMHDQCTHLSMVCIAAPMVPTVACYVGKPMQSYHIPHLGSRAVDVHCHC